MSASGTSRIIRPRPRLFTIGVKRTYTLPLPSPPKQTQHADVRLDLGRRGLGHQGFAFLTYNTTNADMPERHPGCDGHRTRHIQNRFHCPSRDTQPPQPEGRRQIYKVSAVGTPHPQFGYGKACPIPVPRAFCQAYRNCKTRALVSVPKRSNRPNRPKLSLNRQSFLSASCATRADPTHRGRWRRVEQLRDFKV